MTNRDLAERIDRLERRVLSAIGYVTNLEEQAMADLTELTAQVEANTSAEESAVVLLDRLADLVEQNATDPTALAGLVSDLRSSGSDLAAAIARNTPSDPGTGDGGDTGTGDTETPPTA